MNRKKRNNTNENERVKLEREWWLQKCKVQRLVREAKENWETKLALEIRNNGENGRKLWNHINILSGKRKDDEKTDL